MTVPAKATIAAVILLAVVACASAPPSGPARRAQQAVVPNAPDVSVPASSAQESNDGLATLERSIDLCAGQRPSVPEEARRHFIRGASLAKLAKTHDEFRLAATEYRDGLTIAPCVSDAYFNYALVLQLAEEPKSAIQALNLYLRAAPNAPDAEKVHTKIYELQAAVDMQARRIPATVYIYREWRFIGSANNFAINIGGRAVGALPNASYLVQRLAPGEATFTANGPFASAPPLKIPVEPGKTYYVELYVGWGVDFHVVEQKEGAEAIERLTQR